MVLSDHLPLGPAAAGAIGMINSCGNLGGFVGPYLTGWIKTTTGSFAGAYVYLACSLTAAGLMILTFRKQVPTDALDEKPARLKSVEEKANPLPRA